MKKIKILILFFLSINLLIANWFTGDLENKTSSNIWEINAEYNTGNNLTESNQEDAIKTNETANKWVPSIKDVVSEKNIKIEEKEKIKEVETKIEELNTFLETNDLKSETLNNIIEEVSLKLNNLDGKIKSIQEENSKTSEKDKETIIKNEILIKDIKNQKDLLMKQIESYQEDLISLNKEKFEKEQYLKQYSEIKKKYENLLEAKINNKFINLLIFYIIYLSLWLSILLLWFKIKSDKIQIIGNVVFAFFFILSIIISFFYLYPEAVIYLIFIASAVIIISKNLIISILTSIFLITKYKIDDIIEIQGKELRGKIKSISTFSVELYVIDDKNNYLNKIVKVPNEIVFTSLITKEGTTNLIKDSFSFILKNNLNYKEITSELETFLNKAIEQPLNNLNNHKNTKFKKMIKIQEGKVIVIYNWNEKVESLLEIKEGLLLILLKYWLTEENDIEGKKEKKEEGNKEELIG